MRRKSKFTYYTTGKDKIKVFIIISFSLVMLNKVGDLAGELLKEIN